ncbi:MAG TPA: PIN domain-containing protein [Bryobacteraceae bacterium]|nr:PIN domain-containing protein [Bryobacteraceae bacterium]
MPRVVLDTNVIVSAHINPNGLRASGPELGARSGLFRQWTNPPRIRRRSSPRKVQDRQQAGGGVHTPNSQPNHLVTPLHSVTEARDPDDNHFLECAEAAGADYLVTGNKKHFPSSYKNARVVDAREFLDLIV